MDKKLKWCASFCAVLIGTGLYVDNKPPTPLDFDNPATLHYDNVKKHADNGVSAAQYVLATYYQYGNPTEGVKKDQARALTLFKLAADQSNAPAAFEYAAMISKSNPQEAQAYYRKSIAGGFKAALFALSQLKMHENSPSSVKEGLALLYAAANANDPLALAYFATLQYEGAGVQKDPVGAILRMQSAAQQAPTPETKKSWTTTQEKWFNALTEKEHEELNDRLMMNTMDKNAQGIGIDTPNISSLMADLPINRPKAVGK